MQESQTRTLTNGITSRGLRNGNKAKRLKKQTNTKLGKRERLRLRERKALNAKKHTIAAREKTITDRKQRRKERKSVRVAAYKASRKAHQGLITELKVLVDKVNKLTAELDRLRPPKVVAVLPRLVTNDAFFKAFKAGFRRIPFAQTFGQGTLEIKEAVGRGSYAVFNVAYPDVHFHFPGIAKSVALGMKGGIYTIKQWHTYWGNTINQLEALPGWSKYVEKSFWKSVCKWLTDLGYARERNSFMQAVGFYGKDVSVGGCLKPEPNDNIPRVVGPLIVESVRVVSAPVAEKEVSLKVSVPIHTKPTDQTAGSKSVGSTIPAIYPKVDNGVKAQEKLLSAIPRSSPVFDPESFSLFAEDGSVDQDKLVAEWKERRDNAGEKAQLSKSVQPTKSSLEPKLQQVRENIKPEPKLGDVKPNIGQLTQKQSEEFNMLFSGVHSIVFGDRAEHKLADVNPSTPPLTKPLLAVSGTLSHPFIQDAAVKQVVVGKPRIATYTSTRDLYRGQPRYKGVFVEQRDLYISLGLNSIQDWDVD